MHVNSEFVRNEIDKNELQLKKYYEQPFSMKGCFVKEGWASECAAQVDVSADLLRGLSSRHCQSYFPGDAFFFDDTSALPRQRSRPSSTTIDTFYSLR
jgi:hypothetical protein